MKHGKKKRFYLFKPRGPRNLNANVPGSSLNYKYEECKMTSICATCSVVLDLELFILQARDINLILSS